MHECDYFMWGGSEGPPQKILKNLPRILRLLDSPRVGGGGYKIFWSDLHWSQEWSRWAPKSLKKADPWNKPDTPSYTYTLKWSKKIVWVIKRWEQVVSTINVPDKYFFCHEFIIFTWQYLQTPSPVYLYTVKIENFRHILMSPLALGHIIMKIVWVIKRWEQVVSTIYVPDKYFFCHEFIIFTRQYLQTPSPVYLYTVKIENFRHILMSPLALGHIIMKCLNCLDFIN